MPREFVSEPIEPVPGTMDVSAMTRAGPGLPRRFLWRGREHTVASVIRRWKETGPCRSGSPEQYVRKHWFLIRTTDGAEMEIYFERQARSAKQRHTRWWLFAVNERPS